MSRFSLGRCIWALMVWAIAEIGCSSLLAATAQIVPDATLGSESSQVISDVDASGEGVERIIGGASAGSNLFHSFSDFNVGELQRVYFANPAGIDTILSRVTGESDSNIFGTLGVEGAADLFFMNPNGIVFGENAALDIKSSFYATTASELLFGRNESFSAVSPKSPSSVLIVSPSAFLFSQNEPAAIENRSVAVSRLDPFVDLETFGLRVPDGQSLSLIGGDINVISGGLVAVSGRINVGGLAEEGAVQLSFANGSPSLEFPEDVPLSDVNITDGSGLFVAGDGSGEVAVYSGNLYLSNASSITAGILNSADGTGNIPGDISLSSIENLVVENGSSVFNTVRGGGKGDSGNVSLGARQIVISEGSQVGVLTFGEGDTGSVEVQALESVTLDGGETGNLTGLFTQTNTDTNNSSGNIRLSTRSTEIKNGAQVNSITFGQGNSGDIEIESLESTNISASGAFSSGVFANVGFGANGDSGSISIESKNLEISDGAELNTSTFGVGNSGDIDIEVVGNITVSGFNRSSIESDIGSSAEGDGGDINIRAATISLQDGATIGAVTSGVGDTGDINITTDGDIRVEGLSDTRFTTLILNRVSGGAEGEGGDINISSGGSFLMTNAAQISAITEGLGDSGDVLIEARDNVSLINSSIFTEVSDGEVSGSTGGIGDAGDITIRTGNLLLSDGSQLRLDTENEGNAGNAFILAEDSITITGEGPGSGPNRASIVFSAISSTVEEDAVGEGGNIDITTGRLEINDGFISTETLSQGGAGDITIIVDSLNANDGAQVLASTSGTGNSGLISIDAQGDVVFRGRDSSDFPSGLFSGIEGNVGEAQDRSSQGIKLTARSLVISDRAQFSSSTRGNGDAGDIVINVSEDLSLSNSLIIAEVSENVGRGSGGSIIINAGVLELANGSFLLADTENVGDAGSILIETSKGIILSGRDSDNTPSQITATVEGNAVGEGGNIDIITNILKMTDGAFIETSTAGQGSAGNIAIDVNSLTATDGAFINAVSLSADFAGDIDIQTDRLEFLDSDIKTSATQSSGGNIGVNALNSDLSGIIILRGDSDITTDSAGNGGNINLNSITIAFEDSDIITRSTDQSGGDIAIGPFFSQTLPVDRAEPFDGDGRVDVNLDGPLSSGQLVTPETSFVLNSLSELSAALPPVDSLTAGSCIARAQADGDSSFTVTGTEAIPQQPGSSTISLYPTSSPHEERTAQIIQEPENAYQLADGRWVLSHDCSH